VLALLYTDDCKRGLRDIALAAIAYWLAGRLAVLMAIPPGYATAVWPAAGLALVSVLACGPRVAFGVALGSLCVNFGASCEAHVVAGAIGLGAALQALLGAALIRRRVGYPSALAEARDILMFVGLGGPLACLASCTVGVSTLAIAGVIDWASAPFHWWTWWAGDTIGVLVFAPLALLVVRSPFPVWHRRRLVVGVPLVFGFCAVTLLFVRASGWERDRLHTDFERRASTVTAVLRTQLSTYEEVVSDLASYLEVAPAVSRRDFAAFSARALATHPGLSALRWHPRVAADERAAFEARAAREVPGFAFRELGPDGAIRAAGLRDEYVPILYAEPASYPAVLGFDTASDAVRRAALARAARSPGLSVTPRIDLVQTSARDAPPGVLLISAVRDRATGAVRGYAVAVFQLQALLDAALHETDHDGLVASLVDASAGSALLDRAGGAEAAASPLGRHRVAVAFGDRRWRIEIAPTPAYVAAQRSWYSWVVLAGGLAFVAMLGLVLLMTTGHAAVLHTLNGDLEARVAARTSELTASLREREVLLQEVHHRVKNNLQIISSLINMHVRKLDDTASRDALEECQTRVLAIALIHEKLYQSRDYARVPFSEYVRSLVLNVFHTTGVAPGAVQLQTSIDHLAVPVDKAIPCGLLLNELITNALKHAFKDGRRGVLQVELFRAGARVHLVVSDNGVGLPAGFDVQRSGSLGLQLVSTLAEQLDASLTITSRGGARFEVAFDMENG